MAKWDERRNALAVQNRSPTLGQSATHAAWSLLAFLPPLVVILSWPALYFGLYGFRNYPVESDDDEP